MGLCQRLYMYNLLDSAYSIGEALHRRLFTKSAAIHSKDAVLQLPAALPYDATGEELMVNRGNCAPVKTHAAPPWTLVSAVARKEFEPPLTG